MHPCLTGFDAAIQQSFPTEAPSIIEFCENILAEANVSPVDAQVEEADFAKFISNLDYDKQESVCILLKRRFHADLVVWRDKPVPVGKMCGGVEGAGLPEPREFTLIQIAQHQVIFFRWNEKLTRIFKDDQQIGSIEWAFGRNLTIRHGAYDVVSIKYPFLPWQKISVALHGGGEMLFPTVWPSPDNLPQSTVTALAAIPFQIQLAIAGVIIWRSNYTGAN